VRKILIKNSQLFGKKFQKTLEGNFFDSHCIQRHDRRIQNLFMIMFMVMKLTLINNQVAIITSETDNYK